MVVVKEEGGREEGKEREERRMEEREGRGREKKRPLRVRKSCFLQAC